MANWREAAEKYRHHARIVVSEVKRDEEFIHAAEQLHDFLASDLGAEARDLLKASCSWIEFGRESVPGTDFVSRYVLSEWGLIWFMSPKTLDDDTDSVLITEITTQVAVNVAVRLGNKDPDDLIRWLSGELDKIAAAAPEPVKK